jgi:hypothetical protein
MSTVARGQDRKLVAEAVRQTFPLLPSMIDTVTSIRSSEIDVHIETSDFALAWSNLNALQFCFEVAALLIEADVPPPLPPVDATRDLVGFTIVEVTNGSIRLRFTVDPRTVAGRTRLLTLITLGLGIASQLVPSVGVPYEIANLVGMGLLALAPDALQTVDLVTANQVKSTVSSSSPSKSTDSFDEAVRLAVERHLAELGIKKTATPKMFDIMRLDDEADTKASPTAEAFAAKPTSFKFISSPSDENSVPADTPEWLRHKEAGS